MKKLTLVVFCIAIVLAWLAACAASTATPTAETGEPVGLPNPASVHCEERGGRLELRTDENGAFGVCIFEDGSECEEWAYFRRECALGETGAAKPSVDEPSLVDTDWELVSLRGNPLVEDTQIMIRFEEAWLSGFAGCNAYGGGPDSGEYRMTAEGQLELLTARGESLLFESLPEDARVALEGPTWSLLAFIEPNPVVGMPVVLPLATEPLAGSEITAMFSDGKLEGSAGCNRYSAAYRPDGESPAIESLEFTEMACPEPEGVLQQEDRYLGVLKEVIAGRTYGGQLWLDSGDGRALVFQVSPED